MRHAKQGTTHAGRRRTARPEYNDGRLLSCKNWEDRQAIARRVTRVEQRPWNRKTKKGRRARGPLCVSSGLHTIPFPSIIWIYRFGARFVSFSIRLLGGGQWISSSSIFSAAPMPRTSLRSCEER